MSFTLTTLASDNFNRANVNPLTSPWALDEAGDAGLQISSDLCINANYTGSGIVQGVQLYSYDLPEDQFVTITVSSPSNAGESFQFCRCTDDGSSYNLAGYALVIQNAYWSLYQYVGGVGTGLASGNLSAAGHQLTLAAIGSTIYFLIDGVQVSAVTNTTYSSGGAALGTLSAFTNTYPVTSFAIGSASTTYEIYGNVEVNGVEVVADGSPSGYSGVSSYSYNPPGGFANGNFNIGALPNGTYEIVPSLAGYTFSPASRSVTISDNNVTDVNFTTKVLPFLGSIRIVANAPTGRANPFVGTVIKVSSAPTGVPAPYLGNVVAGSAPAGRANPSLGNVVEVDSAPSDDTDPFLGTMAGT